MGNHIIFVHGRKPKPSLEDLRDLWYDAIRFGLRRDYGDASVEAFDGAAKSFAYYGDLSNELLVPDAAAREEEMTRLVAQRRITLLALKARRRREFRKRQYNRIRQIRDFLGEAVHYLAMKVVGLLGKSDDVADLIGQDKADLESFWNRTGAFNAGVRRRVGDAIEATLAAGDRVLIVAHSLGTMIVYDALWELSWGSRAGVAGGRQVDTWITLGSPLGADVVKEQLNGWTEAGERKFPSNVDVWLNFSAEDDEIASDEDLGDDFAAMSELHGTRIEDRRIYSLALRDGKAHPHSGLGYLIHPEFVDAVGRWLGVVGRSATQRTTFASEP